MLALREVHAPGATRVSIGGHHILTGGADGVVSLFSAKQWPKSAALWSFNCHEAAVTDVVLADSLALALSCGRDGRILLHESIFDTAKLVSRVICQVTGEVRCLQLDVERRRVYIAGDSLRCLDMAQDRFRIQTIPLVVPFPIVSLAISPCGRLIAMGSASGELGVVSAPPSSSTATSTDAAATAAAASAKVQFIFRSVLSPTAKKDDAAHYRMAWCTTEAGGLMLMVPTATEVQVYQLDDAASPPRMRAVGGLHDRQLVDLHGALVYRVTKNRLACVMASSDGIFIGKVEAKNLAMARHTSEQYRRAANGEAAAVTDVQVNAVTGDVVVGLSDGCISLLRKAALREWRPTAAGAVKAKAAAMDAAATQEDGGELDGETPDKNSHATAKAKKGGGTENDDDDDDFINDDDDDTASESSVDSASTAASSESAVAPEDFGKVVVDLQRSGASVHDNDEGRPSRWRDDDAAAALAHAEREAERHRTRSRFLDDEAEEGSAEDDEDEDAADDDDNVRASRYHRAADQDEEDASEGDRYDNASLEGLAEDRDGCADGGRNTSSSSAANAPLPSGRVPAVQDYSFQVGATPAGEEGSCYLAYNSVGYIHHSREATTVHFHDISFPAVRVQLRDTILMGSLSPVGAGFVVVPAEPSDAQGSVDEAPRLSVFYHAFTPLGAQSEWRVSLLPGETVRCLAAGIRYLAVATSHYLRIFSLSGLELAVLSKSQRIVTMVGTSSRALMSSFKADFDPLAIISLSGTGELLMEVVDVGARAAALPARAIPLTELPDGSTHQLQWLGWSEDGLLHTADTAGVVRMYTEDWGGSWVPVYDPRTLVDQSYALWVYGVSDHALLAYRYSRDDPSYPAAAASGLSTELVPLFLPLTRTMGEEGRERWDKVLRQQIRGDELKRHAAFYGPTIAKYDEVHDHHLLQFFESALKGQQTTRALELAMLMEIHDRVVKCAQLANSNGYAKLVPKLLALYEMRMATKSKRRCTLPLREAMLSDRKKDELLRKLLGQMLPQDRKGKTAESPAAEASSGGSLATAVPVEDDEEAEQKKRREVSPTRAPPSSPSAAATAGRADTSPSTTSTATTVDVAAPPKSAVPSTSTAARRHISFAREVVPRTAATAASPLMLSQTSTNTDVSSLAPQTVTGPRKVSNPFAKPSAAAAVSGEARTSSVTATATASARAHQTRLGNACTTATASAASSLSLSPKQTTLLGASQFSTPPRTKVTTAAPSVSVPGVAAVAQEQQQQEKDDAATSLSSLGNTPEDRRVSAGHAAESPAVPHRDNASTVSHHTAKPTTGFVARELPTHTATAANVSSGPVDPFLAVEETLKTTAAAMPGPGFLAGSAGVSRNTSTSYPTATPQEVPSVSVQSLLDVGHEETAPVVRSDSFGEALRKRYRDDDEAEDELGGTPLAAVPKLTL
ncbi:hypothetical protein ABB37_08234 [Leptomonas pyrrhocoris]|uniref:Uncharacterized protein n=1 Tax=Leptomonas pyrrhocoris TaxID=157538 RepID=A0A0M9FTF9_LEPPY|nr:hypothetical protein ABB37_08234 [Leptomonas pyrrhocoris]KPA75673.1 hypothetical protein ABB37_08234 [Leptomonas pyrrhocoris]|eukprot:XP_015654112.1 hypothetical protein ABB37_08234 [Leptomonas pyrrhocoris]